MQHAPRASGEDLGHAATYDGRPQPRTACARLCHRLRGFPCAHRMCVLMSVACLCLFVLFTLSHNQIGAEDVEEWVVKAITAGLVDARIDELKKVVVVSRYSQREFGDENWRQLAARLTTWRSNVAAMLDTLQSGRVGARAAMGSAGAGAV